MSVVLAEPLEPGPAGLEQWAQSFLTLARVSGDMARTAFVPESLRVFRNNGRDYDSEATAAQVTAAILTGRELGLEPMASLRSIHVINSSPALSALALRAIVLGAGHRIWVEEANNTRAAVAGVRAGDTHEQRVTWTMDDARSRGIAGKRNWRTQPRNMLIARATAEVARLVAADAILGVPYAIEELEDDDIEPAEPQPPADAKPLRRRRKPAAPALATRSQAHTEQPTPDEPPLDDQSPTPRATDQQMKKLFALFGEHNLRDRDERLRWANEHLDREIASANELTDIEASTLIDALESAPASAPPAELPTEPAASEEPASEQRSFDEDEIVDVTDARVGMLTWARSESGVPDSWLREKLRGYGVSVPERGPLGNETFRQLSQKQAGELLAEMSAIIDARNAGQE